MVYYLVAGLYVLVCLVLMLVVLIQQGKGGDLAAAFGGGSSQAAFGARTGATLLTKVTWVCASLFVIGALALSILGQRGPGSVIGSAPMPRPAATQPAPTPATPPATPAPSQDPAPAQPKP
jgi:preprotein translocase subunit SecG